MISRAGQLWEYRPGETFSWRLIVVLKSEWGPDIADFVGAKIFHTAMYAREMRRTDLIENLEPPRPGRWEDLPDNFRRIA